MNIKKCAYCGADATTKDHFIPVNYYKNVQRKGKRRYLTSMYGKENLIDCCSECNSMASDKIFDDIESKRRHIQERITKKYKKIIDLPFWSKEEISAMGRAFKKDIKIQQLARKWILNRISYPKEVYPVIKLNKELAKFINNEL